MKRALLYIFFFNLVVLAASAQHWKKYAFTHYGTTSGLASNETISIVQDQQGFVWVSTTNGLQRFDGVRFQTFRHKKNDPTSIPANYVHQLVLDKKQNLWIQFGGGRFGIFDTKKFTFREVPLKPSNPEFMIGDKKIVIDEAGNIMVVIGNLELLTYNEEAHEFSPKHNFVHFPRDWGITDIYNQPGTSKYWIGTQHGIALYDKKTDLLSNRAHNYAKDPLLETFGQLNGCVNFFFDAKGRLWFDTWDGFPVLYCYDLKEKTTVLNKYNLNSIIGLYHEVRGFTQQKNGTIWIKGLGVFARYIEEKKEFEMVFNGYENEQSISYTRVDGLYEDRDENLWVCTNNNGIYMFNPSAQFFTNIRAINRGNNRPGEGSIMALNAAKDNTILVGAWGDGLFRYDANFNLLPLNIKGFSEKGTPSVWDMWASKDSNTLWLAAQPGVYRVDQAKGTATFYNPDPIRRETVRQIAEDRFGNLWIGMYNSGLYKWTAEKGRTKFDEGFAAFTALPKNTILDIHIDKRGFIWVSTSANGLFVIDPATDKVVTHFGKAEPAERRLLADGVAAVIDYDDTTMAIAANSLTLYNTKQQKVMQTIGMPETIPGTIASMQKDSFGYLWVSATSGLFRVNPKNKIFIHFDRVDGIANDYFIVGAAHTLPDGRLLFGADNQFVSFDPTAVLINDKSPDIAITGFKLMNKSLSVDSLLKLDRIDLAPEDNSITIDFSGLSFSSAYIIKYKLENLEKEWKMADKNYEAIYSYLPPGTYTFLARSEDAEGRPGKTVTKLVIKVQPPFWKTWWFLGMVIFAATTILFFLDKLRMQRLRATESIRTRIATSLTEDMSNSLSNINISSELAKTKMDTDKERTKEYIGQISETSNRMVQSMYDMVWSIDPKNDTMANTIERMKIFATETENTYPVNIDFDVDKQVARLPLDMERRYELLSIFKEAVTNAGKHSGGRYIKVSLRFNKPKLMMMIIDDGRGFSMDDAAMLGRGMGDMRRRTAMIDAVLYIESEINTGTVVKLEMPVV